MKSAVLRGLLHYVARGLSSAVLRGNRPFNKKGDINMIVRHSLMLIVATGAIQGAFANTVHVCSTCANKTIQSAVNTAASGDTIVIAEGRYTENVTIIGKSLTLQGVADGTGGVSEVYATSRGPVFTLGSGTSGDTPRLIEMHNLTIAHGNHTGGTGQGGGIQVRAGAYLHLYDSTITHNFATLAAGISINTPGAPASLISGCVIEDNQTPISVQGQTNLGGGVGVFGNSSLSVMASTFTRNLTNDGGGLYTEVGTHLTVDGSTFSENVAQPWSGPFGPGGGSGGGMGTFGSVSISNSSFVNNLGAGPDGGGGLYLFMLSDDTHVITNTIVARNNNVAASPSGTVAGPGGGIAAAGGRPESGAVLTINSSYIVQNQAEGGIWYDSLRVALALNNTAVTGNVGGQICDNVSACIP
jgi:hypothetical protein